MFDDYWYKAENRQNNDNIYKKKIYLDDDAWLQKDNGL